MSDTHGDHNEDNKRAARLIVTLLVALIGLAEAFINQGDGGPFEDGEVPALDKARAAIAKAERETLMPDDIELSGGIRAEWADGEIVLIDTMIMVNQE